ncbi:hypothetical protein FQA47_016928, partial [Oryzias melastigma]
MFGFDTVSCQGEQQQEGARLSYLECDTPPGFLVTGGAHSHSLKVTVHWRRYGLPFLLLLLLSVLAVNTPQCTQSLDAVWQGL